jgi:endonuclease/exonuclease/phosphatase family metal-dependent hydrolase
MSTHPSSLAGVRRCLPAQLLAAVLALTCVFTPRLGAVDCNSIQVLTFNLRFDDGWSTCLSDCDNVWYKGEGNNPARRDVAKAYLQAIDPDIFGLQEVRNPVPFPGLRVSQLQDVIGWFPGHGHYELDRGDGEHCAIFYRTERFARAAAGTFWLSCTPDQQSHHPLETGNFRIVSWVFLIDLYTGTTFYVFNAHWPLNEVARQYSAALVRDRIQEIAGDRPALLMGDLNCGENSTEFRILNRTAGYLATSDCSTSPTWAGLPGRALLNSYRQANPTISAGESTYHNFGGGTFGGRIDHILHFPGYFEPYSAAIRRDGYPGGCGSDTCQPSDHFGVEVNFRALMPEIHVEFSRNDQLCEAGTPALPFNSMAEALQAVQANGTVTLRNTSGSAGVTLNPKRGPITLTSIGGPSTVGK